MSQSEVAETVKSSGGFVEGLFDGFKQGSYGRGLRVGESARLVRHVNVEWQTKRLSYILNRHGGEFTRTQRGSANVHAHDTVGYGGEDAASGSRIDFAL